MLSSCWIPTVWIHEGVGLYTRRFKSKDLIIIASESKSFLYLKTQRLCQRLYLYPILLYSHLGTALPR